MRYIFNCTQHKETREQIDSGVYSVTEYVESIQELLTFVLIPTQSEMDDRAKKLAVMAKITGAKEVMLGGAPFFMSTLEKAMIDVGIRPIYAFSERVSIENAETGKKKSVFKHKGFVKI